MSKLLASVGTLQVVTILVAMLRAKVLSLVLGPSQFGVASTVDQLVLSLGTLGALSLPFTGLKFLAHAHGQGAEAFRGVGAALLRALMLLAAVTFLGASAVLLWNPSVFGSGLAPHRGVVFLALVSVPAAMLSMLLVNIFAAAGEPVRASGLTLLSGGSLAAAAILGAVIGGLPGLYLASGLAGALLVGLVLKRLRDRFAFPLGDSAASLQKTLALHPTLVAYSAYIYLATGTYAVTMIFLRTTVLSSLGAASAGLLQAALSIALTLGAILGAATNMVLVPVLNRPTVEVEKLSAANDFLRKCMVVLVLAAVPVVLFPELVLWVLFSGEFVAAAQILLLCVVWQCIYQIGNVYHQLLVGLDDVRFTAVSTSVSYGVVALLLVWTVPLWGLAGAPVALSSGMLLRGGAAVWRLRARFAIRLPAEMGWRVAACLLVVVSGGVLFSGVPEHEIGGIALRLGYLPVGILTAWFMLSEAERHLAREGPAKVLARIRHGLSPRGRNG